MEHPLKELLPDVTLKELAVRHAGGLAISLYWHEASNTLSECVTDKATKKSIVFLVPNDSGLDALAHPFHYAAMEGLYLDEE